MCPCPVNLYVWFLPSLWAASPPSPRCSQRRCLSHVATILSDIILSYYTITTYAYLLKNIRSFQCNLFYYTAFTLLPHAVWSTAAKPVWLYDCANTILYSCHRVMVSWSYRTVLSVARSEVAQWRLTVDPIWKSIWRRKHKGAEISAVNRTTPSITKAIFEKLYIRTGFYCFDFQNTKKMKYTYPHQSDKKSTSSIFQLDIRKVQGLWFRPLSVDHNPSVRRSR